MKWRRTRRGVQREHDFGQQKFGPPAFAHYKGLACGEVDRVLISLHSGDALAAFGGGLRFVDPN